MFDAKICEPTLVFLHVPKTAGQSIHNELSGAFGPENVSPIRVHTQVNGNSSQMPSGYRLYSGHIDWVDLESVANPKFVFSILRDPKERIASFYFYLRKEAQKLSGEMLGRPENIGKRNVLSWSPDDYFFGGNTDWRSFIDDHYNNFYCRYFGSRKIRAGRGFSSLPNRRKLRMALRNLELVDWVYSLENLSALEHDLEHLFQVNVNFSERRDNPGDMPVGELRWPNLIAQFESDKAVRHLESFVDLDLEFMTRLDLN